MSTSTLINLVMAFLVIAVFMYIASLYLSDYLKHMRLPRAYSIAVVGFPQSGKTALITSIFGELFANRIMGVLTVPRGKATIEKINEDIAKLETGRALGPTTDQDLFAYRTDIHRRHFPFKRKYKVEIGDFPGEDSTEFAEKFGNWFHETPYFKWVMEADAFIFVIDLALVLSARDDNEYIAKIRRSIRAAWHHLLEYHIEGKKNLKGKPVIFAFMKADLLATMGEKLRDDSISQESIINEVMNLGFGDTLPKPFEVTSLNSHDTDSIENRFADIIRYLRSHSRNLKTVFVSAVAYNVNGRLGVKKLLWYILPR